MQMPCRRKWIDYPLLTTCPRTPEMNSFEIGAVFSVFSPWDCTDVKKHKTRWRSVLFPRLPPGFPICPTMVVWGREPWAASCDATVWVLILEPGRLADLVPFPPHPSSMRVP